MECVCVYFLLLPVLRFFLSFHVARTRRIAHTMNFVYDTIFFRVCFFHFFSFLVVDIRFFDRREQHDFVSLGDGKFSPIIFHSTFLASRTKFRAITIHELFIVWHSVFLVSEMFHRSIKKKKTRTRRVLIFRSRITSITAMKMDHFIKSLLLNMIVVWNFPIYILKRSYSSRFDFILILLWFSGVVSTRLRNYRSHLWLFSFWTIKFEAPISIRYTFIPINLVFKLGNFPTKQRETSRWETNGMH